MQAVFEKLENSTLRERIAERIKEAILTRTLHEGQRLVERKLAAEFDTSLTAVREALVQLESEGFVTKKANSATHVTKLSITAAEKIFTVRKVLETYAGEEAARLATPAGVQELEKAYLELVDTARTHDAQVFILKDLALHETIWRLADNEYLEIALRRIVHPIFAFTAIRVLSCRPFDLLEDAHSHLPIIEAIKNKSQMAAREAFMKALDGWSTQTRGYVFGQTQGS